MPKFIAVVLVLLGSAGNISMAATPPHQLHWQHEFSAAEQLKLEQWLAFSSQATLNTLGPYPFEMQLYLYRRAGKEPVPWANTWREHSQQVHFYVAPQFSKQQFIADWTAYHEIAHLALPYLGRKNAWFAEGFASYMQYRIMQQAGLIDSATKEINAKFTPQRKHYLHQLSMVETAAQLLSQRRFAAGYWGGAQFFVVAERLLLQQGKAPLNLQIQRYQQCCRLQDTNLQQVIQSLDSVSDSKIFSQLLQQFNQLPAAQFLQLYQL
ncbi:hypothetical protein HRH59_09120 [Rheinheimera sp. YQF-2]|uniref:Peptidase M61 catalytic domain-containing protein n=1 Tax=Rheinheimera lutimaris TaxID=2740584 RepID=A0A7Y5EIF6_9GAMM|nr:hypothetical protein [Rheinheimera lutimaris]NRQ42722.1 hypothetical protein [Rheinheimera lutimaris]